MGTLRTRLLLREMLGVMVERMPSPESAENLGSADKDVPRKKAAPWGISKQSPRVATPSPAVKAKVGADTAPKLIYGKIAVWPTEVKRVPYEKGEGVGPGERRLAKLLGGDVQGGSATFDLATPEGNFEVKEPTGGWYGGVRVESEGIAALEANLTKIKNVAKKIDSVFGADAKPEMVAAAKEMYPAEIYQKIVDFATKPETKGQTAIQWILRGEIGAKRLRSLGDTLLLIHSGLLSESVIRLARHVQWLMAEEKYVELGDTDADVVVKKPVDTTTYVKVGKALDVSPQEMKVTPADMLRSALNHPAFLEPDAFINAVVTSPVKASQVFGHTDGLILVQPTGYFAIPKAELDQKMQFLRISKGKPYFHMIGGGKGDDEE